MKDNFVDVAECIARLQFRTEEAESFIELIKKRVLELDNMSELQKQDFFVFLNDMQSCIINYISNDEIKKFENR